MNIFLTDILFFLSLSIHSGLSNTPFKTEILQGLEHTLKMQNVYPLQFEPPEWHNLLISRADVLKKAKDPDTYLLELERTLQKFGFSHIRTSLSPSKKNYITPNIFAKSTKDGIKIMEINREGSYLQSTPATKNVKIARGDIILKVDGHKPWSIFDLIAPKDTELSIVVRKSNGKQISEKFKLIPTTHSQNNTHAICKWLGKQQILYLKVPDFASSMNKYHNNPGLERKLVDDIDKSKMVIVDLRDNNGGDLPQVQYLSHLLFGESSRIGWFVGKTEALKISKAISKPLDYVRNPNHFPAIIDSLKKTSYWKDFDKERFPQDVQKYLANYKKRYPKRKGLSPKKIVVLTNGFTTSAGEIMAGLCKDYGAILIGSPTPGQMLSSNYTEISLKGLKREMAVRLPNADYFTWSRKHIESKGVIPNHVIYEQTSLPLNRDPIVIKALALIR